MGGSAAQPLRVLHAFYICSCTSSVYYRQWRTPWVSPDRERLLTEISSRSFVSVECRSSIRWIRQSIPFCAGGRVRPGKPNTFATASGTDPSCRTQQRWNCRASDGTADPCTFPDRNSGPLQKNTDKSNPLEWFANRFPQSPGAFPAWLREFFYFWAGNEEIFRMERRNACICPCCLIGGRLSVRSAESVCGRS